MRKFVKITLVFCFSLSAWADCEPILDLNHQLEEQIQTLAGTPLIACNDVARPLSREDARELLKSMALQQKIQLGSDQNEVSRHTIGKRLNVCEPNAKQKAFIINFEGTGSYSPRTSDLMQRFSSCVDDGDMGKYFHYEAQQMIKKVYGTAEKWSALQSGALNTMATLKGMNNVGWVSFPSEESEVLGDPSKLSSYSNINSGIAPRGIVSAATCLATYLTKAKELGIKPKIIVQGHSSGGRSSVKFIELLNKVDPPIKVDLMFTIDPVKEAHLAVGEVLSQMAGNANRSVYNSIPFVDDVEIKPPNVWTRRQPDTLYKPSNVTRSVNVYQNVDTEGLKGPVKFGIHGSPMDGADIDQFLKEDLASDAHGTIARHKKTQELLKAEYRKLGLIL